MKNMIGIHFKYPKKHTTEFISVKCANIDKNIIPVVLWLNSHQNIHTLHSCEGSQEQSIYVLFTCSDICDLYDVNSIVNDFTESLFKRGWRDGSNITITSEVYRRTLRFNMKFDNTKIRKKFCKYLLENCIDIEWR